MSADKPSTYGCTLSMLQGMTLVCIGLVPEIVCHKHGYVSMCTVEQIGSTDKTLIIIIMGT